MDRNLEQRDLGKNTANEIPMRWTDGREKNLLDFELAALDELVELAALVNEEPSKNKTKNNHDTLSNKWNQCASTFSKASNLRRHLGTHSGAVPDSAIHLEKPPKEAASKSKSMVGGKEKETKMTRPKNYACTHCGTAFVSTKDLARHTVVHTGEKVQQTH